MGLMKDTVRTVKKKPVAVFDIDGTIFRSSLLIELTERLIEKGTFPKEVRGAYETERMRWLDRKGDYEAYIAKVINVFMAHVKGVRFEDMAEAAEEVIEEKQSRVYKYTRDLVRTLRRRGYYLLAISHSPKFIVDAFAYELGFDKVYGFFYETGPSGRFTGNVEDKDVILNKAAVLQRAVRKEGLTFERSVGVGDTESDIPMLDMVERPIAFNPNQVLYRHAKRRKWKVVIERKDVIYEL